MGLLSRVTPFNTILLVMALGGCFAPGPAPVPPPTPSPVPTPTGLTADDFLHVEEGVPIEDALAALPAPHREVDTDGGKTIYAWRLDDPRATSQSQTVWWEIHAVAGVVVWSGSW